ncbi:Holliday junction resolvase RuvX [bacterium]|nr:Holliday junction resolvase RuvX [bacterium]
MRILGIDFGGKRIGIAVSDETGFLASALKVIENRGEEKVLEELKEIISSFEVEEIVIGLPKMMDGSLGREAAKVHSFASSLRENLSCPINFWDERLSTVEAQNILIQGNLSRKKRKKVIDKLSAVIILQGYLDKKRI